MAEGLDVYKRQGWRKSKRDVKEEAVKGGEGGSPETWERRNERERMKREQAGSENRLEGRNAVLEALRSGSCLLYTSRCV